MPSNTFITPMWVTTDVAMYWKNNIKVVSSFDRQYNDEWLTKGGAKIGDTVQVRLPQRWTVSDGQGFVQQSILNQTTPLTINHQFQVGMGWSSSQSSLYVEDVQDRYTSKAGIALANKTDVVAGAEVYKSVYYSVGTPGSFITSNETWTDAVALLRSFGTPSPLDAIVTPLQQSKLLANNFQLLNPTADVSKYWREGVFATNALGADQWGWDINLPTHTTGSFTASTPLVNGGTQTGSTLTTDGWGTYALKAGDVFTLDGVYGVNPISYENTGILQQFVLTADVSGSTTATLSFSPSIITSGQLQTVTGSPADNASISVLGSTGSVGGTMTATASKQNLIFNGAAFAFVVVDLPTNLPGATSTRKTDREAKVSMRLAEQWNIQTDQLGSRLDLLCGTAPIEPYFALRAWN